MALIYLIAFGALIGFTAYIWLLRVGSPTRAASRDERRASRAKARRDRALWPRRRPGRDLAPLQQ